MTIYPNSTILGGETVIGANVFLIHNVPPDSLVVYEEKQLVIRDKSTRKKEAALERGYRVDFHASRTTYITRLQRAGVTPREAMELARHSDMRLTMKTYTDAAQLPFADCLRLATHK